MILIFISVLILIFIILLGIYLRYFIPLRPKESGFEYVYIEVDGTVRELDDEEKNYLNHDFSPADGARPYIKSRYKSLTPDGKIFGFIERRRVPKKIIIKN
ncbi:hypothetical protein [Wenyingzhuangia sp. IMCC45574]